MTVRELIKMLELPTANLDLPVIHAQGEMNDDELIGGWELTKFDVKKDGKWIKVSAIRLK